MVLEKGLKSLVLEYLNDEHLTAHGLFRKEEVQRLLREFYGGRKEKHLKVWYLLMFQMWHARWIREVE